MSGRTGIPSVNERAATSTSADQIGIWAGLAEIYAHLSPARRRQFYRVIGWMLVGTFIELATIGAVLPFLSLLADPGGLGELPWPASELAAIGGDSVIAAAAVFAAFALLAGLVRLQLAWAIQDFAFRLGRELIVDIQRRILLQPYSFHIERNTSTLLSALEKVEILVFDVLLRSMQALAAAFMATFLVAA